MPPEEVRPCMRCDGLVSADTFHCPSCGALATPALPTEAAGREATGSTGVSLAEAIVVTAAAAIAAGTAFAFLA